MPLLARRSTLLLASSVWFVWVWATRALNLIQDDREFTVAFLVVHFVLFAVSLGFAAALGVTGWRMRREEQLAVAAASSGVAESAPAEVGAP